MSFSKLVISSHHSNTMGQSLSEAKMATAQKGLSALEEIADQKLESFILRAQAARGSKPTYNDKEIGGGRSFIRVAQKRVATSTTLDADVTAGVDDFFVSAGLASAGDKSDAKITAINGASKLAKAALKSIVGAASGASAETVGFEVLFVKGAFIRVDYFLYHYNVSGQAWFKATQDSLYVTCMDSSVLDATTLKPAERAFLIARAIDYTDGSPFDKVEGIEADLAKLALFSKLIDTLSATAIADKDIFKNFVGIIDKAKDTLKNKKSTIKDVLPKGGYRPANVFNFQKPTPEALAAAAQEAADAAVRKAADAKEAAKEAAKKAAAANGVRQQGED